MNDLLETGDVDEDILPEPFPRLQTFSGSIDFCTGHTKENYYNIEGLHGKIYDGPGLTVHEIRKKFSRKCQSSLRRSMSNPNFIGSVSAEKLNEIRVKSGFGSPKSHHSKKSLTNLIPDALKKHLSKDSLHHSSHGTLSNGGLSSHNSSRGGSAHSSRHNSFSKRTTSKEDILAKTSVKGITVTKRSRSFRRQKACDDSSTEKSEDKLGGEASSEQSKDNNGNIVSESRDEIQAKGLGNKVEGALKKPPSTAPKPSPKPLPKPAASSSVKVVQNSATVSETSTVLAQSVRIDMSESHEENNAMATTEV